MGERVFVVGVGMTKFEKPGSRDWDYPDMVREAGTKALEDAGISYDKVEQAIAAYCYGDSTSGQEALYEIGLTGIPIINVNNNCSTGSSALFLARQLIQGGIADCVMAAGFEKMQRGSLKSGFTDRANPVQPHIETILKKFELTDAPPNLPASLTPESVPSK
jgi:acetyl-CoA acyltransferase